MTVTVSPGSSIQSAVTANPAGTTFMLSTGTHVQQSVIPKAGNRFIGTAGTILDGQNVALHAFHEDVSLVPDVLISTLEVKNYVCASQRGAINAGGDYGGSPGHAEDCTTGWEVSDCNIHHNAVIGLRLGHRMKALRNLTHHNGCLGIGGVGNNAIISSNEINDNNYLDAFDPDIEAGGLKFVLSRGVIISRNLCHDNHGPGLWGDIDNLEAIIEENDCTSNLREGIVIETCHAATIRANTCIGNGLTDTRPWLWSAGIAAHASPDCVIYYNTVTNNRSGIVGIQQARGSGLYGAHLLRRLRVFDNVITQSSAGRPSDTNCAAGIVQDNGDLNVFGFYNNAFFSNTYILGANTVPFAWLNANRTITEWRSYNLDTNGVFS